MCSDWFCRRSGGFGDKEVEEGDTKMNALEIRFLLGIAVASPFLFAFGYLIAMKIEPWVRRWIHRES